MTIKEAQKYIKTHRCKILADSADAVFAVLSAIKNGYTLCKAEEAVENIKRYSKTIGTRYSNVEEKVIKTQEAIDVIKEACE